MKSIQKVTYLIVLVVLAIVFTGCSQATTPTAVPILAEPTKVPPTDMTPLKVAMLFRGVVNDAGFAAAGYSGLLAAKEQFGVEIAYTENVALADTENTFRDYASQGYDLIIGHAGDFADAALTVSEEFPETWFAITNSSVSAANVIGLDTKNEESGYMAGIVAGLLTKTKKVAFIGGTEMIATQRASEGFKLGVKEVCPDCTAMVSEVGSWVDLAKGKEAGFAMIEGGADVLFQYADAAGLGVIDAAKEKNIIVIGSGLDQSSLAPDNLATTTIQTLDPVIISIVDDLVKGKLSANQVRLNGYDNGTYSLAPLNEKLITPEQATIIQSYVEKLKTHELVLPHLK